MSQLSKQQKLNLYRAGQYKFPAPSGPTAFWNDQDWINYVDTHGRWLVPTKVLTVRFTGRLDTERCAMYPTTTHIQVKNEPQTQEQLRTALADGNVHGFAYQVKAGCTITTDE